MIKLLAIVMGLVLAFSIGLIVYKKTSKARKLALDIEPYVWAIFAALIVLLIGMYFVGWLNKLGLYPD